MRARAFTLLEVLMATALLGFGILTMIGVFISGIKLISEGRDMTAATDLARSELEAIQQAGYDRLPLTATTYDGRPGGVVPVAPGFPPAPFPGRQVNNQNLWLVVSVTDQASNLKSVVVACYWGGNNAHTTLETLLSP